MNQKDSGITTPITPLHTSSRKLSGINPSTARMIRSVLGMLLINCQKPSLESGYLLFSGLRIRYQFEPSARLRFMADRSSISSIEQKTALTSGCLSRSILAAVFLPMPGIPLRHTARQSGSIFSIGAVLSIVTVLTLIFSYTPFRIPPIICTRLSESSSSPSIIWAALAKSLLTTNTALSAYCARTPASVSNPTGALSRIT